MAGTLRFKKKKKRWFALTLFLIILLTAAGAVLYRCPPSLQVIGRIIQSAVGKILFNSAGQSPAELVLRGTVYDRSFNELAVSYRLYSLHVYPAEIDDIHATAHVLAPIVGREPSAIEAQLMGSQRPLELADGLDEQQAEQISALQLAGVSCRASEVRFYPAHTAASHVLGFMGDGIGLAGVEGRYDAVLSPGVFRTINIPDIDFQGREVLGEGTTDLVLTLDLALQRQLENRFREYLGAQGTGKGMGLLLEPSTGRILALVNQPSFNPNYFWKASENSRINRIYHHVLEKELIGSILARAAAIELQGLGHEALLPMTVAAPDQGFLPAVLDAFARRIQLYGSVFGNWEIGSGMKEQAGADAFVTGVQVGVTLASLVNGGWRITPYVVDSVYDHATRTRYRRHSEATERHHVLNPVLGVRIRRELFTPWLVEEEDMVLFTAAHEQVHKRTMHSRYSMQELFVGLAPARQPRLLLLMAVERDHLLPAPAQNRPGTDALKAMGRELLTSFTQHEFTDTLLEEPPEKSEENLRQFFIGKRLDSFQEPETIQEQAAVMPTVTGLSLRRGLQILAPYNIKVRVHGNGRIIAQYPLPGVSLAGVDECILTLDSNGVQP
ncbi:hypothetical protein [Desulfobulbus alkaliphilus]|uniref:hypothetical protein n=1 Tax=Desulfobulbus alkaliphilus TaxID=869814 RepID=UPI001965E91D|nr:hypothetical protein [Desulfobulbus alkaliphilus]MBM9536032.1 hypothetical protein [Desulfobulbus alkaliphilus]